MSNQKFIADAMLGNIAKKLRLFGYDTMYFSNIKDNELISIAKKENRIVLTRDKNLTSRAIKAKVQNILLDSESEMKQLVQIAKILCINNFSININNVRCSLCNERIESIEKQRILERVPEGIKQNKDFWICKRCDKLYWKGTHIEKLEEFTEMLNERL